MSPRPRPSFSELVAALGDPEHAPKAARALGRTRDLAAIPILIARYDLAVRSFDSWEWCGTIDGWMPEMRSAYLRAQALRRAIVTALGDLGRPALEAALALPLGDRPRPSDLVEIARRSGPTSVEVISRALGGRTAYEIKCNVRLLRDLGDPRAIPHLVPLLHHPASSVGGIVWETLVRLGRRDLDGLAALPENVLDPLWKLALRARAGDRRILPELLRTCEAGENGRARNAALGALGNLRAAEGVPWLLRVLDEGSPDATVEIAVEALGKIRNPAAIGPLLRMLSQDQRCFGITWEVQRVLRRLLRSPRPLLDAVANGLAPSRAAGVLSLLSPIEDGDALAEALAHPAVQIREAAAMAAHHVEGRARRHVLLPRLEALALEDGEPCVRRQAAYALGRLHVSSAVTPLRQVQGDPDERVREAATRALEWLAWRH
ncbi:HEAT repeat domain-containing protein [Polyangium sp. y55x31]|uniref:HEAT repeat domain-containing protein n=1 Tax=Polyangium sp. y55x31 TaxID=3042688 RepID=UPI0024830ECF|nr:HEAT repeat domain-containing protein [Polyangium sp. y55x31]MDI1482961.1 HEAT repeat domain-containing protein [Polyangium sp. y55x31]